MKTRWIMEVKIETEEGKPINWRVNYGKITRQALDNNLLGRY